MSVLASKVDRVNHDRKFSKELFVDVAKNLKIFTDEEWESVKETLEYKKLLIAVYVRTDTDNLVLLLYKDKFSNVSNVPPLVTDVGMYPSILVDAGLLCGKNLIDSVFSFSNEEAMKRLVLSSTCFPVGAIETSKKYVVVFNVIVSENILRDKDISLNKGFHFHPIETLYLDDTLQRDIAESLILVKSEGMK